MADADARDGQDALDGHLTGQADDGSGSSWGGAGWTGMCRPAGWTDARDGQDALDGQLVAVGQTFEHNQRKHHCCLMMSSSWPVKHRLCRLQ